MLDRNPWPHIYAACTLLLAIQFCYQLQPAQMAQGAGRSLLSEQRSVSIGATADVSELKSVLEHYTREYVHKNGLIVLNMNENMVFPKWIVVGLLSPSGNCTCMLHSLHLYASATQVSAVSSLHVVLALMVLYQRS